MIVDSLSSLQSEALPRKQKLHMFKIWLNLKISSKLNTILERFREGSEMPSRILNKRRNNIEVNVGIVPKKQKARNPFVRHHSFMTPWKFPLLPNASFGIIDRFPESLQGPIRAFFIHSQIKDVIFIGLYWSRAIEHGIQAHTKILRKWPIDII